MELPNSIEVDITTCISFVYYFLVLLNILSLTSINVTNRLYAQNIVSIYMNIKTFIHQSRIDCRLAPFRRIKRTNYIAKTCTFTCSVLCPLNI